jgi:hypothetical protein
MIISMLRFLNIIVIALLAGISAGILIGFNPMTLSPSTYVEQQQHMLQALRVLMIVLVFVATVITILAALLQRKNRITFLMLLMASAFLIVCIVITRFGNKPIDDLVLTWRVDSLPSDWMELRDQWWSLHILRVITEVVALLLVTWASIKKDHGNASEGAV